MSKETAIKLFETKQVRTHWDADEEKWYFSVVDVIAVLTDSPNPRNYWKVLKHRLAKEGNQSIIDCNQLKMQSADGKYYKTDVADVEQLLRLIQSVPSPKAEPFKLWLARVGYELLEEIENPELAQSRMRELCKAKGYSDEISKTTFGMTPSEYTQFKNLAKPQDNIRDHMTDLELIFTMLGEASTTEIARTHDAQGFDENQTAAKEGGKVAGNARDELERKSGRRVVSRTNFKSLSDKQRRELDSGQ